MNSYGFDIYRIDFNENLFCVGDIVELKSKSMKMAVTRITGNNVAVAYYYNGKLIHDCFDYRCLVRV